MSAPLGRLTIRIPMELREKLEKDAILAGESLSIHVRKKLEEKVIYTPFLWINSNLKISMDQLKNAKMVLDKNYV